jgi:hypothetical protein
MSVNYRGEWSGGITAKGLDMIKAYSDLAGVSIYYNYFGGADLLIAKTQRANAAS